ncbi:hypothetical protein EJ05DRAFT_479086 [Pseudovirgaria hyperparasitica]|uniref:Uncharacterized protein n=1 Tax=Pseudovirgaria hyperparasitica TaxID=470096 RepID=A0A6A6VXU6_9PEZI|nr:uncharacterized protein EJ05DRAFT_479086 [Pseudovirgaria hyperparasitica]KAF2754649.1 hypothetical protein EJ05DRAFT_479086 [Pseudovirgaria hyperparasitica]
MLELDPIAIKVGKADTTLTHFGGLTKLPKRKPAIHHFISLMKSEEDWHNLVLLLEGLEGTENGLSKALKVTVLHKIINEDKFSILVKIVGNPEKYGFRLTDPDISEGVITAIHQHASLHAWDSQRVRHAFKAADQFVDLSTRDFYRADPTVQRNPHLIASALEMITKLISLGVAGDLEKARGREYAERFMAVVKQENLWKKNDLMPKSHMRWQRYWLPPVIGMWNAVKQALAVAEEIKLEDRQLTQDVEENLRLQLAEVKLTSRVLTHDLESCGWLF